LIFIRHYFSSCVQERRHSNSPDGDKDIDPLILNLIDIGQEMMVNLRLINLRPHPCYRDPEPINLYHKVGHGTLDMYVLSPSKDSREVREFMLKWHASDSKLFAGSHKKDSNSIIFPVQNLVSICALLVWQPANPEDTITRILFPGSTPQHKIFEGFERLRHLEFLKHTVCTAKSLSPSSSLVTLKDKVAIMKPKLGSVERETNKRIADMRKDKRDTSEIKAVKKDSVIEDANIKNSIGKPVPVPQPKIETKAKKVVENKKIESETKEIKHIEKELKETKKDVKKVEKSERLESETKKTDIKVETEKTAITKENKVQKIDIKKKENREAPKPIIKTSKPESVIKSTFKSIEKKPKPIGEKKDIMKSSPTTPKKSMNGVLTRTEISKAATKSTNKIIPKMSSTAPAKSTKDANNRLVVERKNIELSSMSGSGGSTAGIKAASKAKPAERKAISRRTKPVSPSKARLPISPAKSTRSTPTASVKSEKDAVIRKIKGETTDSSAVSTPSGIDPESVIKLIDKNLTERSEDISLDSIESKVLADLKEEREVVEEIEAVLQKAERIEEARKEERFEGDDDITAEATDKKEEDMTEEDVTAEIDDIPKKISRKESHELTEEDEYLIVEKEEIFTEDSVQSGETEQKHHLDELESEKSRIKIEKDSQAGPFEPAEEKEILEEKKDEVPEKKLEEPLKKKEIRKSIELPPEDRELLKEEMQQIIASAAEVIQKIEDKDISVKKESEEEIKEPTSLSPNKLDSPIKLEMDQKESIPEKLEESQERISTLESGATTTAPTLPEDERIPLDEIKEDIDEKHAIEMVKEKDIIEKHKEKIPEILPIAVKPEIKVLDVQPTTHRGIVRDVVKTPDEVADLPVHEEIDPKLFKLDYSQKYKPEVLQQEKYFQTPSLVMNEEKFKNVHSYFDTIHDKIEKCVGKFSRKARRDSDKDSEDKSSKSSSPKESKLQEKEVFKDIDIEKVFPKIGKIEQKVESVEYMKPDISDIKDVISKETATFLQEEIANLKDQNLVQPASTKTQELKIDDKIDDHNVSEQVKEQLVEDIEEVEAFMEEASNKFKNVKDSLQDSLDSLEEKVDEVNKITTESKDSIKDTLTGVAEKLGDIKSDMNDLIDSKEPEKVKFTIPSEDLEEEDDSEVIVRDFKEAVRDVAGVLVGAAGIDIEKEDKPKHVEEIVKKVAEVLKEKDDFLLDKTPFIDESKPHDSSTSKIEDIITPKKMSITEKIASPEKVKDLIEEEATSSLTPHYKKVEKREISEEPCIEAVKQSNITVSPTIEADSDEEDIRKLCESMMMDDKIEKPVVSIESNTRVDVMDLGLEKVCIKKIADREIREENLEDEKIIVEPQINFQQNISPDKAELVIVTPGSTPSSPKAATALELSEPSAKYMDIFNKEMNLENIIEEFIMVRKEKISMQILEYIVNVKCVPKEKVINIIQEIIIKYKLPPEDVTDAIEILRTCDDISSEQKLEIENYITREFLNKNKKISLAVIEDSCKKYSISKPIVIQIIEDIIVKSKLSRESVFDIPEESYFVILKDDLEKTLEPEIEKEDLLRTIPTTIKVEHSQLPCEKKDKTEPGSSSLGESDEDKMVDGFVSISSTDAIEAFLQQEKSQAQLENKVLRDFEAVEQEYKVHGVSSIPATEKSEQGGTEIEESFDDFNDVIEADEKFVKETIEKVSENEDIKEIKEVNQEYFKDIQASEIPDIDTKEKYLDEAKEKVSNVKVSLADNVLESKDLEQSNVSEKTTKEFEISDDFLKLKDVDEDEPLSNDDKKINDSNIKFEEDSDEIPEQRVKRMVVTASSEDGGDETEICPSENMTKTSSPEDSLEDMKTISRKESSALDEKLIQEEVKTLTEDSLKQTTPTTTEIKIIDKVQSTSSEIIRKSSIVSTPITETLPDSIHSEDISSTENIILQSSAMKIASQPVESLPYAEKETESKQLSEKSVDSEDIQSQIHEEYVDEKSKDRSRSASVDKDIDKREQTLGELEKSDILKQVKHEIISEQADQKRKSSIIENEKKVDIITHDNLIHSDDVRDQAVETVETVKHQSEKHKFSPTIDNQNVETELRKDSIISMDNVQTIEETVATSKDRSKSPSLEKDVDEKKKLSDTDQSDDKLKIHNLEDTIDSQEISTKENISAEVDKHFKKDKPLDTFTKEKDLYRNLHLNIESDTDTKQTLSRQSLTSEDIPILSNEPTISTDKKIDKNIKDISIDQSKDFETEADLIDADESEEKLRKLSKSKSIDKASISNLEKEVECEVKFEKITVSENMKQTIVDEGDDDEFKSISSEKELSPKQSIDSKDMHLSDDTIINKFDVPSKYLRDDENTQPDDGPSEKSNDIKDVKQQTDSVIISGVDDKLRSLSSDKNLKIIATAPEELSSEDELNISDEAIQNKTDKENIKERDASPEKSAVANDMKQISNEKITDKASTSPQFLNAEEEIITKDQFSDKLDDADKTSDATHKELTHQFQDKSKSPSVERDLIIKKEISEEYSAIHSEVQPQDEVVDKIDKKYVSTKINKEEEMKIALPEDLTVREEIEYSKDIKYSRKSSNRSTSPSFEKESLLNEIISETSTIISDEKDKLDVGKDEDAQAKSSTVKNEQTEASITLGEESKSSSLNLEKESGEKDASADEYLSALSTKYEVNQQNVADTLEIKLKSPDEESEKKNESYDKSIVHPVTNVLSEEKITDNKINTSGLSDLDKDKNEIICTRKSSVEVDDEKQKSLKIDDRKHSLLSFESDIHEESDSCDETTKLDKEPDQLKSPKLKIETTLFSEKENKGNDIQNQSSDKTNIQESLDQSSSNIELDAFSRRASSVKSEGLREQFSKSSSPVSERVSDISIHPSDVHIDDRKLSTSSDKFYEPSTTRSKSTSIVSDKSNEIDMFNMSKSPSILNDKLDFELIDDHMEKEYQLSKSKEFSPTNSRSSSISDNKVLIADKHEKYIHDNLTESQDKNDIRQSTSVSPVSDIDRTDINIKESIDQRKESTASNESNIEIKGKDRSRSHSLFEAGDKTPLVRSRAASLYEDKILEKLDIAEHTKDSMDHINVTFEEKDELELSQESLVDLEKHTFKRDSIVYDQEKKDSDHFDFKSTVMPREESPSRKLSVAEKNLKDTIQISKNISPSSEPESLITCESDRPEPFIDEEITISENKRIEVESLLMDDYITRGIKITEPILDQITIKTSLPKYIIIEIIEEILIKKQLSRHSIADQSIFHEDDYDDAQLKSDSERKTTPEISERRSSGYSTPDRQHYENNEHHNVTYSDFESPFHKAFMSGMTEIRTTHITTLSGKSTPDFGVRDGTPDSTSEIAGATVTTIKSVPEKFDESTDDKPSHSELTSSKSSLKEDDKSEQLPKNGDESNKHGDKEKNIVILETTKIITHSEESTDVPEEPVSCERIVKRSLPEIDFIEKEIIERKEEIEKKEIEKEESETLYEEVKREVIKEIGVPSNKQEFVYDDDINKKNIEIITTKTTKTIITKTELDSVSLINTMSTDNISIDKKVTTEVQDDKSIQKSTSSSDDIEEKLISLDSQTRDQFSNSNLNISNEDGKNITDSDNADIPDIEEEKTIFISKDLMDHTVPEQLEQSVSPLIRDLISEERSFSGKSLADISLPKEISEHISSGKSSIDTTISPLIRDSNIIQSHFSGRSTPEKKSDGRSRTATPEGFRSGDVIRTIVTTTRTMSDDGEIITTTQEVTEATNDKGKTIVLNEKTDVKVDERLPENLITDIKPIDIQRISNTSLEKVQHEKESSFPILTAFQKLEKPMSNEDFFNDFLPFTFTSSCHDEFSSESTNFSQSVTKTTEFVPGQDEFSGKKFTVEKEYTGGYEDKDSKKYIDEADLDFEKALRGIKNEEEVSNNDEESSVLGASSSTKEHSTIVQAKSSESDVKQDPLSDWGSPLCLPSPKPPRKFNLRSPIQACSSADLSPDSLNFDVINNWGEPMKLPSPAPIANENSNKASPSTPKKEKKQAKKIISENIKNKKRSESPNKIEKKIKDTKNKVQPVYVDLTYVSHHGNSFYTALEFFKKVRARYYVFSGTEPSREVYDALLEAKKSWEDKDLGNFCLLALTLIIKLEYLIEISMQR
jgi:hypothetical protein